MNSNSPDRTGLTVGITASVRITIDRPRTVAFLGEEGRVYGTPWFVRDVEDLCRALIAPSLHDDEDSLGVAIDLAHQAPALPGATVEIMARVTAIDRRYVSFSFSARDDVEEIGHGTHRRFITEIPRTLARLAIKRTSTESTNK